MDAPKLKSSLATNIPETVTLVKRGKTFPNKFKPGENNYMYFFDKAGHEYVHFGSEKEEDVLKDFQPGDKLQVVLHEAVGNEGKRYGYMVWTPVEGAEARSAATPSLHTNTAQDRIDRSHADHDYQRMVHDYKLGIAGLVQAYLIRGEPEDVAKEKSVAMALWVRKKAEELANDNV